MSTDIRVRTPISRSPIDEPAAVAWIRAAMLGFAEPEPEEREITRWLGELVESDSRLRGIHDDDAAGLRDPAVPVATLASSDSTVNIDGTLVPVNAIADVTTRASHRRRGHLRELITTDLADAARRGLPMAALTVTQAGIYRRFGFGPAVQSLGVAVRTDASFGITAPVAGRTEIVDRAVYLDHVGTLFGEFHRVTSGSVYRPPTTSAALSGLDMAKATPDPRVRFALHLDVDDRCDGAVAWKVVEDGVARVVDMVTPDPAVGPALWSLIGRLELVTSVTYRRARVDDPLRYALIEPDVYAVESRKDFLWLRVLDVVTVLQARTYLTDVDITLAVTDDLGFASGTYRLTAVEGRAQVTALHETATADADVSLDVAALGSVLLGGIGVATLAAAGHIRGRRGDDFGVAMLTRRPPASITPF